MSDHLPIVKPYWAGGILKYRGERYEQSQAIPTQELVSGKKLIYQIPPENGPVYKISLAGSSKYLLPIIRECERESSELRPQVLVGSERSIKKKPTASRPQRGAQDSIAIQLYKVELESKIKNNWSYPAAFIDPNKQKNLEALVLIKVKRDGTIVNSRLEKPSGIASFDESVRRAIGRSNPLPPFPSVFLKPYEEIEINFNLRELEKNS